MSFEPKLTVYNIKIIPENQEIENSNRWLFRNIIGEANETKLADSFIFINLFKKFIKELDQPEMYSDQKSKKCITANQPNIKDPGVSPNIYPDSGKFIIHGQIEGGAYGRVRNKTSTKNKTEKTGVNENDAITDDFYFLIYLPPASNKVILMIQSYSGDSIDSVMKIFFKNFLSVSGVFKPAKISRFVPESIINDFKNKSMVSNLKFTTEVLGKTLLNRSSKLKQRKFRVTVQITPIEGDFTVDEFEDSINSISQVVVTKNRLKDFLRKKGTLRDITTNSQSPFVLGSDFEIQPVIMLSKYIDFKEDKMDFEKVKTYCMELLNEIKPQIYPENGTQER